MSPSRLLEKKRVVLAVTGGIAAYKSAIIARLLVKAGAETHVIMSRSAESFVGPVTFEAITGRPVYRELIAEGHALDHIKIARNADLILVAPATADFLARAAAGRADDLMTATLLATRAPVVIAPAMNDMMWAHAATQRNVRACKEIGYTIVDPDIGPLAEGEGNGPGRMQEPNVLIDHLLRALVSNSPSRIRNRKVVVTAGPTREAIDPVRFISNRSSGRMGVEIAAAAWRRGADVTLIAGPLEVDIPTGVSVVNVESTADMEAATRAQLKMADVLIMAAAPADFGVEQVSGRKLKKSERPDILQLVATKDILLSTQDARKDGSVIVGFALETGNALEEGERKLRSKNLDMIVINDAFEPGAGFGHETNRVTLLERDRAPEVLPLLQKSSVAEAILNRIETIFSGREN